MESIGLLCERGLRARRAHAFESDEWQNSTFQFCRDAQISNLNKFVKISDRELCRECASSRYDEDISVVSYYEFNEIEMKNTTSVEIRMYW